MQAALTRDGYSTPLATGAVEPGSKQEPIARRISLPDGFRAPPLGWTQLGGAASGGSNQPLVAVAPALALAHLTSRDPMSLSGMVDTTRASEALGSVVIGQAPSGNGMQAGFAFDTGVVSRADKQAAISAGDVSPDYLSKGLADQGRTPAVAAGPAYPTSHA